MVLLARERHYHRTQLGTPSGLCVDVDRQGALLSVAVRRNLHHRFAKMSTMAKT